MNGYVDADGRALIVVAIQSAASVARDMQVWNDYDVQVWIDTGFNGDLVLPQRLIDEMALSPSGTVKAILADGAEIALRRYLCWIDWFGEERELELIANVGEFPLLGVGLLMGHRLIVNYRTNEVEID